MVSLAQYLQDWDEACAYAHECGPDLSGLNFHEPYSALVSVVAACFVIWLWNERSLKSKKARAVVAQVAQDVAVVETHGLNQVLEQVQSGAPAFERKAA